ncbi:hypothetical protein KDM41_05405 [bacterium]|nr:hypothetical protein [bacterium]
MSIRTNVLACSLFLLLSGFSAADARADDRPVLARDPRIINGGSAATAKAVVDTIRLMGPRDSGAPYVGDFELGWNGWTSFDETQPPVNHWQVSDYNQPLAGDLAAWCGDLSFPSCDGTLDPAGGYGNNWHDLLSRRIAVHDPGAAATVRVTAALMNDTEPGYDYTYLSVRVADSPAFTDLGTWSGLATVAVDESFTYQAAELVDGTDVHVVFRFQSEGGWSDEDCSFPTAGACQVDDITVTVSQVGQADIVDFTNFQDGTLGAWFLDSPTAVGDFAKLWHSLEDVDACVTNYSSQVAFIDDGVVVPGTGGSLCINWCYGPAGYIVSTTGGLAGPAAHLANSIRSPVMAWPDPASTGALFEFDVYMHEDLSIDAPGIFYLWGIRSADTDNSAGYGVQILDEQPFVDRQVIYFGGPGYKRERNDVTTLLNRGCDEIQVQMGAYEMGWLFGYSGDDGYPAPYLDNVSVKVFPLSGPAMTTREIDLAQDAFPEIDAIDFGDLGSMHVRFDMARNISLASHLRNDPGDSIVCDIVPARPGAVLSGTPQLHYVINANPVFDAYRTTPTSGSVPGSPAVGSGGVPDEKAWAFDLPDTGTLFPGDVLHYYVRAADDAGGDIRYQTLPGDLSGFGDFSQPLAYHSSFVVHALPTIREAFYSKRIPEVLLWNDFANRGGEDEWTTALRFAGFNAGEEYDIYYTNGPSSGVGNGLGGRTSGPSLDGYRAILYTSGNLGTTTLSNGDFLRDAGDDIGTLMSWLDAGERQLFLTGDNLVSDLVYNAGADGLAFAVNVMGVNNYAADLRYFIANQSTPVVRAVPGNSVFSNVSSWIAYGSCPAINTFDAVQTRPGAERLAEFTDPNGSSGSYSFSAATFNRHDETDLVISLPYDLMFVWTDPDDYAPYPLSARDRILRDVFDRFSLLGGIADVPARERFHVANHPNPFNPATRVDYTIRAAGHLSLKVYDIRGRLVRTLVDGRVEQSGFVTWDGTDDRGAGVASGVYFTEARMGGEVQINKMALVK